MKQKNIFAIISLYYVIRLNISLYLIEIRVSVVSLKTSHVRKTKLHVSLDRVLRGNKYHVSRCRVPPWQPSPEVHKESSPFAFLSLKKWHAVECLVSILISDNCNVTININNYTN